MRTWKNQFTIDIADKASALGSLGFADSSWGNDACPSFTHEGLRLSVWVDSEDPDHREHPSQAPYAVCGTDAEGALLEESPLWEGESFAECLGFIASRA